MTGRDLISASASMVVCCRRLAPWFLQRPHHLRTAKIHVAFHECPLRAVLHVQDVMAHLVLFTCHECRVRFLAFHPAHLPRLDAPLQVTQHCPIDVAEWDTPPSAVPTVLAARHTGLCGVCARDLAAHKDDELLSGVSLFGPRNAQDPLDGFPATDVDSLTGLQFSELFRQASVLEAMLVALHHMQVSVCRFDGRRDRRTGLTRFRKNIISFPQRVSELQQQEASYQVYELMML